MALDFVFIFTFILSVFMGYKKGFTQMLLSAVVFIFSIFFIHMIFDGISTSFFNSEFGASILNEITKNINTYISDTGEEIVQKFPLINLFFNQETLNANGFSGVFAQKTLKILVSIPLIFISFFLLKFGVFIVRKILLKISEAPVIGGIDAFLGSISGVLIGLLLVMMIYYVVGYIQFVPSLEFLNQQFESSLIVALIYDFI